MTDLTIRAHAFPCSTCGAVPGQWCDLGSGVRVWAVVHTERTREAEFADALIEARKDYQ